MPNTKKIREEIQEGIDAAMAEIAEAISGMDEEEALAWLEAHYMPPRTRRRRKLQAVCGGCLDSVNGWGKESKGLPFHYPGEGPEECEYCYPRPSFWQRLFGRK